MKKKFLNIIAIPLFLCFLMALYAPAETYAGSYDDFPFDIYDLGRIMVPFFFALLILSSAALALAHRISRRLAAVLSAVFAAVPLAMYIQGTFFSSYLPALDGEPVDWSMFRSQRIVSVVLWGTLLLVALLLSLKKEPEAVQKHSRTISLTGTAFLAVTLCVTLLSGRTLKNKEDLIVTGDGLLTMAPKDNVIVLLLDMVGEPEFADYLERHPEDAELFTDFTHFDNAVGGYRYTVCSIPHMLSGEWYRYQCEFEDFKNASYADSPLLNELSRKGYSLGIYEADAALTSDSEERFVNIREPGSNRFREPWKFLLMQVELAGLRYFPFDLKPFCMLSPQNISEDSAKGTAGEDLYDAESAYLYFRLKDEGISVSDGQPAFRFYHTGGVHPPFYYDSRFNYVEGDVPLEEAFGSCITLTRELLEKMKAADIYDSSAVVILADHGGEGSRQNPILYVKGIGERHPEAVSSAPVAWEDLPEALIRLSEGKSSEEIFDWKEGDERERLYYSYGVFGNDPLVEYIQYGAAGDPETLLPTGTTYIK